MYRKHPSFYVGNIQNNLKKRTEQHFQGVAQKVQCDKTPDSFAAHFAQHFNQKLTPQQCREILIFRILSTVNPIGPMKNWSKSSFTLCKKGSLEIISRSRCSHGKPINTCSEVYGACCHDPRFHGFIRN